MSLQSFLNPIEEIEEEEDMATHEITILQEVIQEHLGLPSAEADEEEEEVLERPLPTIQEARYALQTLIEYTEGSSGLGKSYSRALERLTTDIEALVISSRQQSTLDSWFTYLFNLITCFRYTDISIITILRSGQIHIVITGVLLYLQNHNKPQAYPAVSQIKLSKNLHDTRFAFH